MRPLAGTVKASAALKATSRTGGSVEAFESQATFGNQCMDEFALVFRQLGIEELGTPADIGPQGLATGGPHLHVITSLGPG